MDKFQEFLIKSKDLSKSANFENIQIVLGNESCDLDTTISTLSLAYLLYNKENKPIIPVINCIKKMFHLRTETCYLLKKTQIDCNFLVFKDDISLVDLAKSNQVFLVDHHILAEKDKHLINSVVEIFDHRPIDLQGLTQNLSIRKIIISPVGSCSTLITSEIINFNETLLFYELSLLLYSTIVFDTIALNKAFGKTSDTDIAIASKLEKLFKFTSRKSIFDELWNIHNDVSNLNIEDLLYRDLKIVKNIPIAGLPMLVSDYIKREHAEKSINSFNNEFCGKITILIGLEANTDVKRDIGIFFTDTKYKDKIIQVLHTSGKDLELNEMQSNLKNFILFQQNNIKLTRKFILPLIKEAANQCE